MAYSTGRILCLVYSVCFGSSSFLTSSHLHTSFRTKSRSSAVTHANGEAEETQNYLSHIQLRVSDINATIEYWVEKKSATLQVYNQRGNSTGAFVGYAPKQSDPVFLSLELTQLPKSQPFNLGNIISYVGLSMLMKYDYTSRKDVNQLIVDTKPPPRPLFTKTQSNVKVAETETDPNGIPVKYVASAPGDPLSRFCLRCPDPEKAATFYTSVLGMKIVAEDGQMVCLRFPSTGKVPTTLVFEKYDGEIVHGNCFDHIVVETNDLQKVEERAKPLNAIFMTPRTMFASTVMGLTDFNGYKIYVSQR